MRGFTLVELLVVMGIFVVITGLILADNNRFGGAILLENLAYDVALSVRQAQVYGISVRQFETVSFQVSYGMYFTVGSSYSLFGDKNGNGLWDGGEDVSPSPYDIGRGFGISKLCAPKGADEGCIDTRARLDIVFKRPEPDACISANGATSFNTSGVCISTTESARIVLTSPRGDTRSVIVEKSGQIAVE